MQLVIELRLEKQILKINKKSFIKSFLRRQFAVSSYINHLNSQKIRKFESYFREYSTKAKKDYRLKLSLFSAKHQFEQHREEVSFFDILNNQKNRRKDSLSKENNQILEKYKEEDYACQETDKNIVDTTILVKKRKRGRPKQISLGETLDTEKKSNSFKQDYQEYTYKIVELVQVGYISQNLLKVQDINQECQFTFLQQDTQISSLNSLIEIGKYSSALAMLLKLNITPQNIIKLLNIGVISRLSVQVIQNLCLKLNYDQKTVDLKYFQSDATERKFINLSRLKYNSVREKTVRKIYNVFKSHHIRGDKMQCLALQSKIKQFTTNNDIEFKRQIINLMHQSTSHGLTNFDKFFHELNSQR